jgi:hypothetical protein
MWSLRNQEINVLYYVQAVVEIHILLSTNQSEAYTDLSTISSTFIYPFCTEEQVLGPLSVHRVEMELVMFFPKSYSYISSLDV